MLLVQVRLPLLRYPLKLRLESLSSMHMLRLQNRYVTFLLDVFHHFYDILYNTYPLDPQMIFRFHTLYKQMKYMLLKVMLLYLLLLLISTVPLLALF